MTHDNSENKTPRYTLRPTFTPLPHANGKTDAKLDADEPSKPESKANSVIRAANEDDDLYDPYSDFHDGTLRSLDFEKDPWD